jgi:CTP:molybdopterin cytidylyltransferase MocA
MKTPNIYPILLAAGPSPRLEFPKALAAFGGKNALEIAAGNCAGLLEPIVVLGYHADKLRKAVPHGAGIVINRGWRAGQLSSLLAALRHVPRAAAFMLYPVDHVFLTPALIHRLVRAFEKRKKGQEILMPRFKGRAGHPVIFSARVREELRHAPTARDVVYRDPRRVFFLPVRTPAIWRDYEPSKPWSRSQRKSQSQSGKRKT